MLGEAGTPLTPPRVGSGPQTANDVSALLVASVFDYAIFMLDPNGDRRPRWNAGAERIKGYRADEIIGKHFSTFYPPDDLGRRDARTTSWRSRAPTAASRTKAGGVRKDGTHVLGQRRDHGAARTPTGGWSASPRSRATSPSAGAARSCCATARSASGCWSTACPDYAIFMLDPDGTVASWNLGAERLKGYRADEIIGRHFSLFYTPEDVARRCARRRRCGRRSQTAGSRTKAGASARTARASGRTW